MIDHLGYCATCGRDVFGPASCPSRGSFHPFGVCAACDPDRWMRRAGYSWAAGVGRGMPPYEIVARRKTILGRDVWLYFLERGEESICHGYLEVKS